MNTIPDTTGESLGLGIAPTLAAGAGVVVHLDAVELGLFKSAILVGHSNRCIGAAAADWSGGHRNGAAA